jgi:kinesin family protein 5
MVKHLFESINNSSETIEFAVKLSMVEIYMEKIRDLLDPTKTNLKVHEDKVKGIILDNCTESFAVAEEEILKLLVRGNENRTIGVTDMNFQSSRSHVIVMLTVKMNDTKECFAKTGKLYLVDLAGSEKPSKNSSQDQTLVEAKMINKSLSTLGRVIYSLTDNSSTYIPYRDSKLTRLLQDSLGGNSKTCLIITASPSILSVDETLNTCRFGVTANTITNNAKINKEYTLAELKAFLQTLEGELESKSQLISLYSSILQEHSIEVPIDSNSKIGSERSSMKIIKYNEPYNTKQREHLSNCNITQSLLVNIPENNKNRQHQSLMREHTGNKINIGTPPKKEGVGNKIKQDQKLHEQINNSVNQIIDLKKNRNTANKYQNT